MSSVRDDSLKRIQYRIYDLPSWVRVTVQRSGVNGIRVRMMIPNKNSSEKESIFSMVAKIMSQEGFDEK
jgi:uncharacterized membrane protein